MGITPRRGNARSAWPWIGSILTAVSLAALLVAPTLAAPAAELREGRVYPGSSGDVRTVWHLRVTFEDDADERPDYMRVVIGGTAHVMDRDQGHDWDRGVRYEWHGRLPEGVHDVVFEARTDAGELLSLGHAAITVEAAAARSDPGAHAGADPRPHAGAHAGPHAEGDAQARTEVRADAASDRRAHHAWDGPTREGPGSEADGPADRGARRCGLDRPGPRRRSDDLHRVRVAIARPCGQRRVRGFAVTIADPGRRPAV